MPCSIATLATELPAASHSAITCAFVSALYLRRVPALSPPIASTYPYMDTILTGRQTDGKVGSPVGYASRARPS
jgi:hypothetical protein